MKLTFVVFAALFAFITASGQWTAGMDDDAGKAAELDAPPSDVVPDLTYTQHYGF